LKRIAAVAMAGALTCGPLQAQSTGSDFSYSPVSPGAWVYRTVAGGSEAAFVDGAGTTRLVIGCGNVTRLVTLSRASTIPSTSISLWTSSATRQLTARYDQPSGRVIAQVGASDGLLDAMVFSRGRFAVLIPGASMLVMPAGTEIAHIVEDCRA
jgi:hypothetical protein